MASIAAVKHFVPEQIISNDDLSAFMETSDEWIRTRSGIEQRHWLRRGNEKFKSMTNHEMVYNAALQALNEAGLAKEEVDAIVYATISPDNEVPGSGVLLQQLLGIKDPIPVVEIRNQCSGFIFGLMVARSYVDSGSSKCVLVVGAEIQSSGLDLSTAGRATTVLFADGCGVAVIIPDTCSEGIHQILGIKLVTDGQYADKLGIRYPGFSRPVTVAPDDFDNGATGLFPEMDGKFVFKMASHFMPEVIRDLLKEHDLSPAQLKMIIPHQANQRIIDMLQASFAGEVSVFSNIAHYGNTTAASIPIATSEAISKGLIKSGDLIALVSFGAGFSWGACLIRW